MNAVEAVVLVVVGGTVAGILVGFLTIIFEDYWSPRHSAKVSAKAGNDVVTLDATVVLGWLKASSPDALRNVVVGLMGLEDIRAQQRTRTESKFDATIDGPYGKARDYLDSARRAGLDTDKGKKHLDKSIQHFQMAAENYSEVAPRRESWACLHLLLICTALGDISVAQEWGARGWTAAKRWVRAELRAFENRREMRLGRWSLLGRVSILPYLLATIIVISRGEHFSIGMVNHEILSLSAAAYLALLAFMLTMSQDHYRQFAAWRAKAQMKECDRFLDEMWKIWSSMSPDPAQIMPYRVRRIDDHTPNKDGKTDMSRSGMYVKTYVLRPADAPSHAATHVRAQKVGGQSPGVVIDWGYYEARLNSDKFELVRSLFDRMESVIEDRGLGWVPELQPKYFAFQPPGGSNRIGVDFDSGINFVNKTGRRFRRLSAYLAVEKLQRYAVELWIKLPDAPDERKHLIHEFANLYPALFGLRSITTDSIVTGSIDLDSIATDQRWRWQIPTLEMLPDVAPAIELASRYQ
jgi:hypothetical protein